MKNDIRRMARELNIPVTVRRVPEGVIFWRSADEDLHETKEVAQHLHAAAQGNRKVRLGGRRK